MLEKDVISKINKKTIAVFLSHIQGFNGLSSNLLNFLKKKKSYLSKMLVNPMEQHLKKKLGTFGKCQIFLFTTLITCQQLKVAWFVQMIRKYFIY